MTELSNRQDVKYSSYWNTNLHRQTTVASFRWRTSTWQCVGSV